jgi:thiosulfate dehydrogenase [quinone] large subunit
LRAFLAVTFTFAGLQKLANPGFFNSHNPTSIQAQLAEAAHSSPISFLVVHLQHVAVPIGAVIALAEVAVGLGTGLGLYARVAAGGGLLLSLSLFLTVSFHASPYYTGSDIVFVFAWLPLVVAGSGGVFALDAIVDRLASKRAARGLHAGGAGEIDRRTFVLKSLTAGAVGGVAVLLAGLAASLGRLAGNSGGSSATSNTPSLGGQAQSTTTTPTSSGSPTSARAPAKVARPKGRRVGPAMDVPVGGGATFTDPSTGDPAVVVQPAAGTFVAFDAVCPHEGCTVMFYESADKFICPCHGSEFNGRTGALERGPATVGLTPIEITEGSDGDLYAV